MAKTDKEQVVLSPRLEELNLLNRPASVTDLPTAQALLTSIESKGNLKRCDPFRFGSRYLGENDNVYEFNAWDHVETDDAYKEYAEIQYTKQREAPVSDFDKSKYAISISFTWELNVLRIMMIYQMHSSSDGPRANER